MSTPHLYKAFSFRDDKKSQMLWNYNETKGTVDTPDQLFSTYTCKGKTNVL